MKGQQCSLNLKLYASDGAELVESVELADTIAKRLLGLLGRDDLPAGSGMVLAPCSSVHTCFMRFSLDLIFFSRDYLIIRSIKNVRPWRFVGGGHSAWGVLEARSGWLPHHRLSVGDRLTLSCKRPAVTSC